MRWAADDEAPVPRRPPGAVALVGVDVGVGEPEPRVWAPGGMERRLRGLDKFAGGGFREEDIVTRRTGGEGNGCFINNRKEGDGEDAVRR